ncbi:hypothetical protein HUJ05_004128 [Dendroctonus ponderosae]|nr:hypothetical protein HUJ05_004128 [Dendroctonus ponderosae]KAH1024675.1 hypothetical protein HUJ05_004128 [Dendroctonus ponderosae]
MADELDVEAMLEAPYKKTDEVNGKAKENGESKDRRNSDKRRSHTPNRSRSRNKRSRSRSKDKKRVSRDNKKRSRSKDRRKSRDRRRTSKDRVNKSKDRRSRSRDRKSKSKERRRSRSKNRRSVSRDKRDRTRGNAGRRSRDKARSRSRDKRTRSKDKVVRDRRSRSRDRKRSPSPIKPPFRKTAPRSPLGLRGQSPLEELSSEERDARTVFCMQLSQRIRARDLEEFFSAALGLSGQKLMGVPIIVQHTQAEKNRLGNAMPNLMPKGMIGPMRLYVGSLHFNITEEMLRGIFEPFGKIENIQLIMDPETGRSKGYGFITFHNCDDAKKALEQLNGFELAGRPMKVGNVTERIDLQSQGPSLLDSDELDRSGIDLGATGRLQLMFKLAETAGMQVPAAAANALSMATGQPVVQQVQSNSTPPIATQCFMLSNMFDPATETNPTWDIEIRDDVIEECNKHGGVLHVYVDKGSPQGNVYVKCPSIATAVASVNSLHGRWFAGRVITAAYVPLLNYHSLFPDAMTAAQLLLPSARK